MGAFIILLLLWHQRKEWLEYKHRFNNMLDVQTKAQEEALGIQRASYENKLNKG